MTGLLQKFGPFTFRQPEQSLEIDGRPVRLGSRTTAILKALLDAAGELVEQRMLVSAVWPGLAVDDSGLRVHIAALRRALAAEDGSRIYISNEVGRGYRLACAVDSLSAAASRPAASTQSAMFPVRPASIHGRSAIVEELRLRLAEHRFLSIVGPGGIGKTTVALAIASESVERGTRAHFVDLASVRSPDLVASTIAQAFNFGAVGEDPLPTILAALGTEDEILVILDNCEHVVDVAAGLAETMLSEAPNLSLLVTSREPLRARGEWMHRLSPLPVAPASSTVEEARNYAAIALFVERARAVWADFQLAPDNVASVCNICNQLDGLPLAIEFAAARLDVMDIAALSEGLSDRLRFMMRGRRTALPRQQTLRATMDWSYEQLAEDTQFFLQHLSVFRSSFTLDDASVVAQTGQDDLAAFRQVEELAAKSLLSVERTDVGVRYRLLETTRHYAEEKLVERGASSVFKRRHAERCRAVLSDVPPAVIGDERRQLVLRHARLLNDVRAAIGWCFSESGDVDLGIRLVIATSELWFHLSLMGEYFRETKRALDHVEGASLAETVDEVQLLCAIGQAAYHSQWPPRTSGQAYRRALAIAKKLDLSAMELRCLWGSWANHMLNGTYADGLGQAREFTRIATDVTTTNVHLHTGQLMEAFAEHLNGNQMASWEIIELLRQSQKERDAVPIPALKQVYGVLTYEAVRARTAWIMGLPSTALDIASDLADQLLASAHDLTICTNFAVTILPVHLWCGKTAKAEELLEQFEFFSKRNGNLHWLRWADGFRAAISGGQTDEFETFLQLDTAVTVGRSDALLKVAEAGRDKQPSWCQAEILRQIAMTRSGINDDQRVKWLIEAYEIAADRGERAWQLRIATNLAEIGHGPSSPEFSGLLPRVLASYSEGFDTRDLTYAATVAANLPCGA